MKTWSSTPAQQLSGKSLPKEFQAVRVHLLAHACLQPQPSLGARCACSFLARPLLERHMVLHAEDGGGLGPQGNGAPALLRCSLCPHVFHFASSFQLHLSQHASKPFQCKVCLRFFRKRSIMIGHLKTHAGALMYHCTVCAVYFSTLKLVSSHMKLHMDCLPSDFNIEQTFMYNNAQMFMFRCTTPKSPSPV
ncbi:hypothetical protein AAFF_G00088050 [Aldrovandia affinis]|uniref:C2H2-type domain-containing protein n=1 Tax=Aldrovandia affinis TaxID=143900 RepID=A0AAD7VXY1_9TELE|nr:hypothetical protein AAFF_G00088050 [Aldrovandia affinis]